MRPSPPIGSVSDRCESRAGTRSRKEQRRRGAEERDKKEARGTHNPSPGAPRQRANKSVLGLCFIPVIRFSPLVLIVASPNRPNSPTPPSPPPAINDLLKP